MFVHVYKFTRLNGKVDTGVIERNENWVNMWWAQNGDTHPGGIANIIRFEGHQYLINEDLTLSYVAPFLKEAVPTKPRTIINKK